MILKEIKWQEHYKNGKLWIDGYIGIVSKQTKHLYDYRTNFEGHEGLPAIRIGIWTKFYDNGQIAWQIDYGNSIIKYHYDTCNKILYNPFENRKKFVQCRKDGSFIIYQKY